MKFLEVHARGSCSRFMEVCVQEKLVGVRRLAVIVTALLAVILALPTDGGAAASPGVNPSGAPSVSASQNAGSHAGGTAGSQKRWTSDDIVHSHPGAYKIGPGIVQVQPGVAILISEEMAEPSHVSRHETGGVYDACPYLWLCLWENAFSDTRGWGYGIALTECQDGASFIDLGHESFPDFNITYSGPTWNDRISAYINNQSDGTEAWFLNYSDDPGWLTVWNTFAPDYYGNLSLVGINDIIDGVHVC